MMIFGQDHRKCTMYLALVRPHLGYATQVWCPQSIKLMKSIERVQRRATKYILMLPFQTDWSYQDRLIQCNLLPISYWHEMMDLTFLYKATNGFIDIDRSILPTIRRSARVTRSCHTSNATTYTSKRCRTFNLPAFILDTYKQVLEFSTYLH